MRQGPSESATKFPVGTKKRGNDGNMWIIIKTKSGVQRWQKIVKKSRKRMTHQSWQKQIEKREKTTAKITNTNTYIPKNKLTTRDRIYCIHDNFTRPFKVVADNKGIQIFTYKIVTEDYQTEDYTKLVKQFTNFFGYWSGYDSSPYKFHGNSILIQISKNEYVSVGWEIYSFKTDEEILDYVSPVGNSDVPYPVAFGENNVYFMLDKKYIRKDDLETSVTVKNAEKLYSEFYGHIGTKQGKQPKYNMKNVKIIQKRVF